MTAPNRRTFLLSTAASGLALQSSSFAQSTPTPTPAVSPETRVLLQGDGLNLTPVEYALLLSKLVSEADTKADTYLKGGAVEQLETRFARILGKERALFLPTGSLANHLAVRILAGDRRHVLLQEESHLYRDTSDCATALSGLNLVPLAPLRATIKASEITQAIERASAPPYPVPVGAISIESPVRRTRGQVFDFEEMKKIASLARDRKIGLHLDGARMFIASAYTGIAPATYAALFDTVYVSLYKYFNAPFGAILAGPQATIEAAIRLRHQFGGGLLHAWEPAAIALHFLNGFEERFAEAVRSGEALIAALENQGMRVQRVKGGTNLFGLELLPGPNRGEAVQQRLAASGITVARPPAEGPLWLQINETISRRPVQQIAAALKKALA